MSNQTTSVVPVELVQTIPSFWWFALSSLIIVTFAMVRFRQPNPELLRTTGVAIPFRLATTFGYTVTAAIYIILFYVTCLIPALIPDLLAESFDILGRDLDKTFPQWRSYTLLLSLFLVNTLLKTKIGEEVDSVLRGMLIQLPVGATVPDILVQIKVAPLFLEDQSQIQLFREKTLNSDLLKDSAFEPGAPDHMTYWIRLARMIMMLQEMEDNATFMKYCTARGERISNIHIKFGKLSSKFKIFVEVDRKYSQNNDEISELISSYRENFINEVRNMITEVSRLFAFATVRYWTSENRAEILREIGFNVKVPDFPLVGINRIIKTLVSIFIVLFLFTPLISSFLADLYSYFRTDQFNLIEAEKLFSNFGIFTAWACLAILVYVPILMIVISWKRKMIFGQGQFFRLLIPKHSERPWSFYFVSSIGGGIYGSTMIYIYSVVNYLLDGQALSKAMGSGLPSLGWFCVPAATAWTIAYLSDRDARGIFRRVPDWAIQATWTMLAAGISTVLSNVAMSALDVQAIKWPISPVTRMVYIFVATGLAGAVIGYLIPNAMRARQAEYTDRKNPPEDTSLPKSPVP